MPDPVSRLAMVQSEIDRLFGPGFAQQHPELVSATMASAASDWAASRLASAIEQVAVALVAEEQSPHTTAPWCALIRAWCGHETVDRRHLRRRHGYVGNAPELRSAVRALSLNGLGPWITDPLHELRELQFN